MYEDKYTIDGDNLSLEGIKVVEEFTTCKDRKYLLVKEGEFYNIDRYDDRPGITLSRNMHPGEEGFFFNLFGYVPAYRESDLEFKIRAMAECNKWNRGPVVTPRTVITGID